MRGRLWGVAVHRLCAAKLLFAKKIGRMLRTVELVVHFRIVAGGEALLTNTADKATLVEGMIAHDDFLELKNHFSA